jgi:hypothetical protein
VRVKRYLYSDIDPKVKATTAQHRLASLSNKYGKSLPQSAFRDAFTSLPMDVHKVAGTALARAGARDGTQWIVIAGWSSQDLSPGGNGSGLSSRHSIDFFGVVRIIGALQALQPARPPAFICENTYMQMESNKEEVRIKDVSFICSVLGPQLSWRTLLALVLMHTACATGGPTRPRPHTCS